MREGAVTQPLQQFFTVGCRQDWVERVAPVHSAHSGRNSEPVQVMIAEHDGGSIAQCTNAAQGTQRVWPAVDEIACEPKCVLRLEFLIGTIINLLQQAIERMTTTLKVADDVNVSWVHRTSCHGSTGRYTSAAEGACALQSLVFVLDSTVY
jgi:hypothetical protein